VSYFYKNEILGRARLAHWRTSEAIQILATSDRPLLRAYLGNAYARAGRRDEAEKLTASLAPNPFQEALIYARLGDKDRTLEALQRMTALGPARVGPGPHVPRICLASRRRAAERDSQEGRLAGIAIRHYRLSLAGIYEIGSFSELEAFRGQLAPDLEKDFDKLKLLEPAGVGLFAPKEWSEAILGKITDAR
jgi:hypothetical protein